jgi:hypothetical protein
VPAPRRAAPRRLPPQLCNVPLLCAVQQWRPAAMIGAPTTPRKTTTAAVLGGTGFLEIFTVGG